MRGGGGGFRFSLATSTRHLFLIVNTCSLENVYFLSPAKVFTRLFKAFSLFHDRKTVKLIFVVKGVLLIER